VLPLSWAQIQHGYALALEGKTEAGIAEMLEGLASVRAVHVQVALALSLCWLAEGYAAAAHANHARKALEDAFATMETTGERLYESELHRVRGEIALISEPPDVAEAERCFRIAIDTARGSGAKLWELRAATSLSALLSKQGKRDEATGALAPVCASLPEADIADLRRAKSILDRLGA
jgi:predicted ATPase